MKVSMKYVDEPTPGYFRFRRGKVSLMLRGVPGTREFQDAYEDAVSQHAPQLRKRMRGGASKGTLAWVILEFQKSDAWQERDGLKPSTKAIYQRRFDWLRENYGGELLASFDRRIVKRIRNLPEFRGRPSVADGIVDRLGALWNFADNNLDIELPGVNPTLGIAALHGDVEAAPSWPMELCEAFERHTHRRMVTFYYLSRYTGQRRGDCCDMKWTDFSWLTGEMFVVQEKTGEKLWIRAPQRLLDYLRTLPREGDYILMSPRGTKYRKTSVTNLVCEITAELGFKTVDSKGRGRGYSPHGLRHLCGGELAEAGCSVPQIMAVLGQVTEKQALHYVQQANRRRMGHDAQRMRDGMYERQEREAAIDAAPNVTKIAR